MKTPWHLWVVGGLALLWVSYPAYDYVMMNTRNAAYLADVPADWQAMVFGQPLWVDIAWAVLILAALAGAVLLLLRRRWAWPALTLAFVALAADQAYVVFATAFGFSPQIPVLLGVSALFALYAWWMAKRGVLR